MTHALRKRAVAEAVGTAFLLATVIGSGVMGERLSGGNVAIALLANTIATGAALAALILAFGSISGGHFNPAVTLAAGWQRGISWREVPVYIGAQMAGAFSGVAIAHTMFGLPLFFASHHPRSGGAQVFSEFIATFGLLCIIRGCVRFRSSAAPFAVGAYITAAYWFTASTCFANPAVTLARAASDTFAGIRLRDTPAFIAVQLAGAGAATLLFHWLGLTRVLILCTGNSARSQMAEGLLRHDGGDRFAVVSAGVEPTRVRPEAIEVMREIGIDISEHRSKSVDEFVGQHFDYVITVCDNANERCPVFPGNVKRIHWSFDDPAATQGYEAARVAVFRRVRDEIRDRLRLFAIINSRPAE